MDVQKEALRKSCELIYNAINVDCFLIDIQQNEVPMNTLCKECVKLQQRYNLDKKCTKLHIDGAYSSERWGGKYEYLCPLGMCFIASNIPKDAELRYSLVAGPFFMTEYDEFLREGLPNVFLDKNTYNLGDIAKSIAYIQCNRVSYIAEIINLVAKNAGYILRTGNALKNESEDASKRVYEIMYQHKDIKETMELQLALEKQLLNNIKLKNSTKARKLLNDILGGIYFNSFGEIRIIKARVTELVVMLLREAIAAGVNMDSTFALSGDYIEQIHSFDNIRDLDTWLAKVLNSITYSVFPGNNVRHSAVVNKVKKYISKNYMKKISLNELAGLAGFSVSYLSKIFKEETQKSISSYINYIRIESAKELLVSSDISLVELAYVVGFEEQSYFTKVFKKQEGVAPGKYRDVNLKLNND